MLAKNQKPSFLVLVAALFLCLLLIGCSSSGAKTTSGSSQAKANSGEPFALTELRFHDAVIKVPDTLDAHPGIDADNSISLSLPEDSQNPFAFGMNLFFNSEVSYTARDAYEAVAEFSDSAKLVEANGIEFFIETEPLDNMTSISTTFNINGCVYSIYADYGKSIDSSYGRYANNLYQYVSPIGANSTSGATADATIPAGAISWQDAQSHIGESVVVYGPVVKTNYASTVNGRPTYLDLGVAYPDTSGVSAIIWGEDRGNFSGDPAMTYQGKTICVAGEPYMYKGQCYIKVTSPSQIQVL